MPQHWEKGQQAAGRWAASAESASHPPSSDPGQLSLFLAQMQLKRKHDAGIWTGRRTGLVIDDAHVKKDGDGLDDIESFFNSAHIDDASSTAGTASLGSYTPRSAGGFSVNAGGAGSSPSTGGRPPSALGAGSGYDDDDGDGDGDTVTEDGREDGGAGGDGDSGDSSGGEVLDGGKDFGDEELTGKRLDYPAAKPTARGSTSSVARSDVSTDEELAAAAAAGVVGAGAGARAAGREEGGDTETEKQSSQRQGRQRHRQPNGATPSRKGDVNGSSSNPPASPPSQPPSPTKGAPGPAASPVPQSSSSKKGTPRSVAATMATRASNRKGRIGIASNSPATAATTVSAAAATAALTEGKDEESKTQGSKDGGGDGGGGDASSDDSDGGGGGWDPYDFSGQADSDEDEVDAASPSRLGETPSRLPFTEDVGSVTPRDRRAASSSPATMSSQARRPPPSPSSRRKGAPNGPSNRSSGSPQPKPRTPLSSRRSRRSGSAGATEAGAGSPAPAAGGRRSGVDAKAKSPEPKSRPTRDDKAKAKERGKEEDRGREGEAEAAKDEEGYEREEAKNDGDDHHDHDQGMMDFGGGGDDDDDDDDGVDDGGESGGGDREEAKKEEDMKGKAKKGNSKGVQEDDDEEEEVKKKLSSTAARKAQKKKSAGNQQVHRRSTVVARLSVGRGRRITAKAAAAAESTPGPPRREGGPRFVDISEVAEVSHTPGVRRSGRHRVGPLKFWRGDNIQYGVDEEGLPVAEGIIKGRALPESASPPRRRQGGGGKKRGRTAVKQEEPISPMSPSKVAALRGKGKKYKLMEKTDKCVVWDEDTGTNKRRLLVASASNMGSHPLLPTQERPPGKEKVGTAAQAFITKSEVGISEWLSGRLELPPGAIKDSESVTYSTQIYVVAEGQPNALELAIAMPQKKPENNKFNQSTAQRFLLSPGDHFFVPVNNVYRLENHSDRAKAVIYWTIVKASTDDTSDEEDEG